LVNRYTGTYELWRSDGTAAGTYSLFPNLFLNYGDYIVTVGNTAFFTADDGIHGPQVWKSDGTLAGTKMVKNINPLGYGSYPYSLFEFKNEVYFGAFDGGGYFYSLWKTDGTESGTIKLKDITPAFWSYYGLYFNHYYSQYFCVSGNTLYFNAADYSANPYQGAQLWKTNGTPQSTQLVKDINPFYDSYPSNLVDVNGTLFFMADDGTDGNELWLSNGTAKGTKLVQDITPGFGGSNLDNLVSAGGKLYFVKDDGWFSTLWSADCNGNANPVTDPGLNGLHNIQALTTAGNKLFFNAFTTKYGTELYAGEAGSDKPSFSLSTMSENGMVVEPDVSKFSVSLYPNPSNGPVTLQIKGASGQTLITITDMNGRTIWQTRFMGASLVNLPSEGIAAGVYTVSVKSGQDNKILKWVKQ
jgi:ELWxxDGT repeat protein